MVDRFAAAAVASIVVLANFALIRPYDFLPNVVVYFSFVIPGTYLLIIPANLIERLDERYLQGKFIASFKWILYILAGILVSNVFIPFVEEPKPPLKETLQVLYVVGSMVGLVYYLALTKIRKLTSVTQRKIAIWVPVAYVVIVPIAYLANLPRLLS